MLSCSIWFSAPSFWMGGGPESRCVDRVCGADGFVHHPHRTNDLRSSSQEDHPSKNSVQKTICRNSTSNAPDDWHMYPKYVDLRIHKKNYLVASSWHFTVFHNTNNFRSFVSYIIDNKYTALNQQNAQNCSFEVHIITSHLTFPHPSARK